MLSSNIGSARLHLAERRRSFRAHVGITVDLRSTDAGRPEDEQAVHVIDISRGGMRVDAPSWVQRDDVLELEVGPMALRAVVVALSQRPGSEGRPDHPVPRQAHLAFVGLTPRLLRELDRFVSHEYTPA